MSLLELSPGRVTPVSLAQYFHSSSFGPVVSLLEKQPVNL